MAAKTPPPDAPETGTEANDAEALRALGMGPDPRVTPTAMNYLEPDVAFAPGAAPKTPKMGREEMGDAVPNAEGRVEVDLTEEDRDRISEAVKRNLPSKPNAAWPRVICMKAGHPDRIVCSLFAWAGAGVDKVDFHPFQRSGPIHPSIVEAVTRDVESRRYGYYWKHFWPTPPVLEVDASGREIPGGKRGDCHGQMHFHDPISGQEIETCIYGSCRTHPMPKHLHHSIWQAMAFVAQLKTDSAIRNYVKLHDPRPQVGHFATLVIDERQRKFLENLGVSTAANENIIF